VVVVLRVRETEMPLVAAQRFDQLTSDAWELEGQVDGRTKKLPIAREDVVDFFVDDVQDAPAGELRVYSFGSTVKARRPIAVFVRSCDDYPTQWQRIRDWFRDRVSWFRRKLSSCRWELHRRLRNCYRRWKRTPESEVRTAIESAGYIVRHDSPGWVNGIWLFYVDHPAGFDAEIRVEPSQYEAVMSICFAASSQEEWRNMEGVLQALRDRRVLEGCYENPGYAMPYSLNIVIGRSRTAGHDSFCQFLRSFAQIVSDTMRQIPECDGRSWKQQV
jgi:hypothetical protein